MYTKKYIFYKKLIRILENLCVLLIHKVREIMQHKIGKIKKEVMR